MITATLDITRLVGVIRRFPEGTGGVTMHGFINEQCRLLVSSSGKVPGLVQVSPPNHGSMVNAKTGKARKTTGGEAKKSGEGALASDVYKAYATPQKLYELIWKYGSKREADRWWWLLKHEPAKAEQYLRFSAPSRILAMRLGFDGGQAHWTNRNPRTGHVKGGPYVIVLNEHAALRKYIKARQRFVGLLASGWVSDAGKLGQVRGVPAWVSRHSARLGVVRQVHNRNGYTVHIANNARHAGRDEQKRANYVLGYRLKALERQIPHVARKLERQLHSLMAAA